MHVQKIERWLCHRKGGLALSAAGSVGSERLLQQQCGRGYVCCQSKVWPWSPNEKGEYRQYNKARNGRAGNGQFCTGNEHEALFLQQNERVYVEPEVIPPPEIRSGSHGSSEIEDIERLVALSRGTQAAEVSMLDVLNDTIATQDELLTMEDAMAGLASQMDMSKREIADSKAMDFQVISTSTTLVSGLSVGYIIWLLRSGTLLASVLSAFPAWRLIDPLPVLGSLNEGEQNTDTETLESMVEQSPDVNGESQNPSGTQRKTVGGPAEISNPATTKRSWR